MGNGELLPPQGGRQASASEACIAHGGRGMGKGLGKGYPGGSSVQGWNWLVGGGALPSLETPKQTLLSSHQEQVFPHTEQTRRSQSGLYTAGLPCSPSRQPKVLPPILVRGVGQRLLATLRKETGSLKCGDTCGGEWTKPPPSCLWITWALGVCVAFPPSFCVLQCL